jgi:hypothetical protein
MDQSVESTRSAKDIIDQTINDNKASEWLLYGYATLFVFAGTTALIWGMVVGEAVVSLAGAISGGMFFPAMKQARSIRKENIAIRLLEAPLSIAETSGAAAEALRKAFIAIIIDKKG